MGECCKQGTALLLALMFIMASFPLNAQTSFEDCRKALSESPDSAYNICEVLLNNASAELSTREEAYIYNSLSSISALNGEFEQAENWLEIASDNIPQLTQNNMLRFNWLRMKGLSQYKQDNFAQALPFMREALSIATILARDSSMATSYNDLGATYMELGRYQEALEMLQSSLKHLSKTERFHSQALTLANIGLIQRDLGNFEESVDYYTRAIDTIEKQLALDPKDKFYLREYAHNHEERGISKLELQQYDKAFEDLQYALAINQDNQFTTEQIRVMAAIARYHNETKNTEQALTILQDALALETPKDDWQSLELRREFANVYQALGELEQAKVYALEGLNIANQKARFQYQLSFLQQLANIYQELGEFDESINFLTQYMALFESYLGEKYNPRIADLKAVIEVQQQQKEIALLEQAQQETNKTLRQQRTIILLVVIALSIFACLLFWVFRLRAREKLHLTREINFHKQELERLTELEESIALDSENEDAISPVNKLQEGAETTNSALTQAKENDDGEYKRMLVALMTDTLNCWEESTGKDKIELAEQSKIWTVVIDNGRLRSRTLDRYLDVKRLPVSPRWRQVVRTTRYVLINCQLNNKHREQLNRQLDDLLDYQKKQAIT